MRIGIPKEVKNHEYRVGITPQTARSLIDAGHVVLVEKSAGVASGFSDEAYSKIGAKIVTDVFDADMIIKVKEPQKNEIDKFHKGQILFCYLHLAPDPEQTKGLLGKEVVGIAYETVTDKLGHLPLLIPMSEIAGRISIQAGANYLQINNGGKGRLLGGVPGVLPANVVIIGGGVVGTEAARMALGLGANVTILDRSLERLRTLDALYNPLRTLFSSPSNIEEIIPTADLVIGAVLIPGKMAPKVITRELIKKMDKGSVFVDVAIDQGGSSDTSRPTTHDNPVYVEEGVTHYCVTNMPGACARTATQALTQATIPYALMIANLGWKEALKNSPGLRDGLNVCMGQVTHPHVATDLAYLYVPPETFL
jgi:alanine dehydrogenase